MPTPPQPTTTTASPAATRAVLWTEPAPVSTPQASSDAETAGTSSGWATSWVRWTTTCSAKAPVLSPWATGSPTASVSSDRSSREKSPAQATWWPRRQAGHSPQVRTSETTTGSPTARSSTPAPSSSTRPAASWPITSGKSVAQPPSTYIRSEWQTAQASTRTRTSPGPGAARTSSSIDCGPPTPRQTAARIVVPSGTARNLAQVGHGLSRGRVRRPGAAARGSGLPR